MEDNVVTLTAVETAAIRQTFPNSSFYNPSQVGIIFNGIQAINSDALLIKFGNVPDDKKIYRCKSGNVSLYITSFNRNNAQIFELTVGTLPEDYSLENRTYEKDNNSLGTSFVGSATPTRSGLLEIPINDAGSNANLVAKNGAYVRLFAASGLPESIYAYVNLIAGNTDENRPTITVSLEEPNIYIYLLPDAGFIDEKQPLTLSWSWDSDALGGSEAFYPMSELIEWRNGDTGEIQSIQIDAGSASYIVPANTFPQTDNLQIRVTVTFNGDFISQSEWVTLTTIDTKPAVEIVYPNSIFIDGSVINEFRWKYIVSTGSLQYGATLQYSTNNGESWEQLGSVIGSDTFYNVPADTLPAGTVLWRVQATNSDGDPSEWSTPETIVVRNAPPPPTVTVNGDSPRPTVEWQAADQQAYQIKAGNYDSGELYGTDKSFKIPVYLPDGSIQIQVRIQNSFGLWSDWVSTNVLIKNNSIGTITLQATPKTHNIRLAWETVGIVSNTMYYIYRDGELIGKTNNTSFLDQLAYGKHTYQVRGTIGDYYAMSNEAYARLLIKTACIAEYGVWDWMDLQIRKGSIPNLATQYGGNITFQHFAGRELPVAEIGDELDITWSFSFSALAKETAEKMQKFFRKLVVYKDPRDGVCIGILNSQQMSSNRYSWDFSFAMRAVDNYEVVEYDL